MKTLLLIDGSSYLYRAFHALPNLRNRKGFPTSVLYGVISMLRSLLNRVPADYIGCVFDARGKSFRELLYAPYKANRPPMPEDMQVQIEPLHAIIRAMGLSVLCVEGVEADDVIGTLALQAAEQSINVIISTGDKDLAQLVTPQIRLENSINNEVLDEAGVLAKFGVFPNQIADYLSLVGDSVDNIPGVNKVGPKIAAKWLQKYGSLEKIIMHADEIKGVVGENLRQALSWLPLTKKLILLDCQVDLKKLLPCGIENLFVSTQDNSFLLSQFHKFGFQTWITELNIISSEATNLVLPNSDSKEEQQYTHYEIINTQIQLDAWLNKLNETKLVAFNVMTHIAESITADIIGFSFAIAPTEAAYIPLQHQDTSRIQLTLQDVLKQLTPWLESVQHTKVAHDSKYNQHILANYNIRLRGIAHDTLLQSYLLSSHESHKIDMLAARLLDIHALSYTALVGKGVKQMDFNEISIDKAAPYAAQSAALTLHLHETMLQKLQANQKLLYIYNAIELPTRSVLFAMERKGVLIDTHALQQQSQELGETIQALQEAAFSLAGQSFNLNSPKQVAEVLFSKLALPVIKKTATGAPSTAEEVLQQLALNYPLPKKLLEYRSLSKLKSTYTDKLPYMVNSTTGRVHTHYSQSVAVTGRLASYDPNLQNIPVRNPEGRRIRQAFIAPPGYKIVSADYSQIELRIMAHLSKDARLLSAFAQGEDIHCVTAAEIFSVSPQQVNSYQRRCAKTINFGLIYGMSAFGLAAQLEIDRSAAKMYIERYFNRYPGVASYMQQTRQMACKNGFVETVLGRRLWLPDINKGNTIQRQAAERAAINAPMQGTAADLIKMAMIAVHSWLQKSSMKTCLIMQVHDELVLEVAENELDLVQSTLPLLMQQVASLSVPLIVEVGIGNNWEEAH